MFSRILKNSYILPLLALLMIFLVLSFLSEHFLDFKNLNAVLRQSSIYALLAFGMTIVILTGGIDLSVGAVSALIGTLFAGMVASSMPPGMAAVIALGLAAIIGLCNGLIVTQLQLPSIVVTLAMMLIARGIALVYTGGYPISGLPDSFRMIGTKGFPFLIAITTFMLLWYFLTQTRAGKYLYAIGDNETAVLYSGININKYKRLAYILCSLCAGIGGIVLASRTGSGQPNSANGFELTAIAAVVLGGTLITGGKGSLLGTLIGALTLGFINNGLNLLGINPFAQQIVKGVIILLAISASALRTKIKY